MGLRDIIVIVIAFGAVPLSVIRPWMGILAWSWLGYMNPHRLTWTVRDWPFADWVGGATLLGLVFTKDRRRVPWTREMVLLALLTVYFTVTTYFSWYPDVSWEQWDKVAKILLFTFVTPMLIFGRQRIRALLLVIVASIGFYGVKGAWFSLTTGGVHKVYGPGNTFIGDNNAIGVALLMVAPVALMLARGESRRWLRITLYATFWLSLISVIFTYSRGALFGLVVLTVALVWQHKTRLLILVISLMLVYEVGTAIVPEKWYARQETTLTYKEDNSAMQRIQAWGVAFNIARERPLLGAGFNFEYWGDDAAWLAHADFLGDWKNKARSAHSIYFQIMGQHGFVALGLFLAILLGTFLRLRALSRLQNVPHAEWIGRYANGLQLGLLPYMVSGAFLSLAYFDLFYTVVALGAILERERAEALATAETPEKSRNQTMPYGKEMPEWASEAEDEVPGQR